MGEEFEDRDLSGSTFWGVNLKDSMFRDAEFSGSTFFHVFFRDVSIDGIVERLLVNGVDVTDYVHANDRWYPLRTMLEPGTAQECQAVWNTLQDEWVQLIARTADMSDNIIRESVNGEWSFRDTLRHLLFVRDKWFNLPFLEQESFTSCGLPNTGSRDFGWPGLDLGADPSLKEVVALREQQNRAFARWLSTADFATLPAGTEIIENGVMPTVMCLHAVLEEEFEHLRYATRDLDILTG